MSLRELLKKTKPFFFVKFIADGKYEVVGEDLIIDDEKCVGMINKVLYKRKEYDVEIVNIG